MNYQEFVSAPARFQGTGFDDEFDRLVGDYYNAVGGWFKKMADRVEKEKPELIPSGERKEIDSIDDVFSKVRQAKKEFFQAVPQKKVNLRDVFKSGNQVVLVAVRAGEDQGYENRLALCKITQGAGEEVDIDIVFVQFAEEVTGENYKELLGKADLEVPGAGVFLENFNGVFSVLEERVRKIGPGLMRRSGVLAGYTRDPLRLPWASIFCQNSGSAVLFTKERKKLDPGVLATEMPIWEKVSPCELEIVPQNRDQLCSLKEVFGPNLKDELVLRIATSR